MSDFFEKITGSIDKGVKAVSSKGKEIIETTKLKHEMKEVENLIQERFQNFDKKVFELVNRGAYNEEEIKSDCKEIASLYRKITDIEEAIKQVELETLKARYGSDTIL